MNRFIQSTLAVSTALLLVGCQGTGWTKTPHAQATEQWNAARAGALTSLAADQLRDGNFDKCQATLDQALRLQPQNVTLHLMAAKLSIEQGRLELAEAHLAEARKLEPDNAEADYYTGLLMERWHQPQRAQAAYADASRKNPAEVAYVLAEAEMLVMLKKPTDALMLLQEKQSHFEHSGVVRHEIGLLLASLGRTDDAIVALRDACRLASDDPTIREHLGFTLFEARQFAEAGEVFERLVKQPEFEKRADVFAALGESMACTKHVYEAKKAYETATKLQPETPGYWLGLARVALQANDLPTADGAVRRAVSLRSSNSDTQCLVGYVRMKQNQLPQALAAFRTAAEMDPKNGVAICMQGHLLSRMGKTVEARECYNRALAVQPDNPLAGRLLAAVDLAE